MANKINTTNLILIITVIGLVLYINFCQETDYLTKKEGKILAEKSDSSMEALRELFKELERIDSSQVINYYYSNEYKTYKLQTDSILAENPMAADSLYQHWVKRLRSGQSPIK